jgi:hypothetical protein
VWMGNVLAISDSMEKAVRPPNLLAVVACTEHALSQLTTANPNAFAELHTLAHIAVNMIRN